VAKIYFFGHGGWDPRGQESGFTTVPSGSTFSFYTEANTLMTLKFGCELIEGTAKGEPDQKFAQFQSCPNMTLYPAPEFHGHVGQAMAKSGATVIVANQALKLKDLFLKYPGQDIVWIACRALEMKATGQAAPGINRVGR
jgi:hypothetical protein